MEVDAIHKIDPEIPVKAITAYVYDEFLANIQEDFAKREGLLFVGGFEMCIRDSCKCEFVFCCI